MITLPKWIHAIGILIAGALLILFAGTHYSDGFGMLLLLVGGALMVAGLAELGVKDPKQVAADLNALIREYGLPALDRLTKLEQQQAQTPPSSPGPPPTHQATWPPP